MTLGEKFGIDSSSNQLFKWTDSAVAEKKSKTNYSFSEVVEKACDELMDRQIKYSIKRILEMEESLSVIEKELDDFLGSKVTN